MRLVFRILILTGLVVLTSTAFAADAPWFRRVLVTNDDGIDNPRLIALARAFAEVAEVVVVAPLENCSGSTNYVSVFREKTLAVETRDMGPGITAWGVDGFPGDCVLLALLELMKDDPPDLVVSGVNSGPNLADAWIASGTIGAARLAAHDGIPAIAFSNLSPKRPSMMEAVPRWCVDLARTDVARNLADSEYLNVNFPRCEADEVKGVAWSVAGERIFRDAFEDGGVDESGRKVWNLKWWMEDGDQASGTDVHGHRERYITVTPLRVGDDDDRPGRVGELPGWTPGSAR